MKKPQGFTIVELLIVIVVIGILATISIVSYNNVTVRARDSQRKSDIATITKALELYYEENGAYPTINNGSTLLNGSWATTNDASWSKLEEALVPAYISAMPKEPTPSTLSPHGTGVLGYAYFADKGGSYCGAGRSQVYILNYRLESGPQKNDLIGQCVGPPVSLNLGLYPNSNYRVVK